MAGFDFKNDYYLNRTNVRDNNYVVRNPKEINYVTANDYEYLSLFGNRKRKKKAMREAGFSDLGDYRKHLKSKGTNLREEVGQLSVFQRAKGFALALPRNATLALININFLDIAGKLKEHKDKNDAQWTKVRNFWYKVGGARVQFGNAVDRGSKKQPILGADGWHYLGGEESTFATAAPIILQLLKMLGIQLDASNQKKIEEEKTKQAQAMAAAEAAAASASSDSDIIDPMLIVGIGAGVVVIGATIYFLTRKKK